MFRLSSVLLACALTSFASTIPTPIQAHSGSTTFTGQFSIIGFADDHTVVILSNNVLFKANTRKNQQLIADWEVGDTVDVISQKKSNQYLLVNQGSAAGETAKVHYKHRIPPR